MSELLDRFLSYVKIDTESVEDVECFPSTEKQKILGNKLVEELQAMGASDVSMDEYGYVFATIPATVTEKLPTIGFISHMDTAPAMSGANVKPRIVNQYDGKDIVLNEGLDIVLSPTKYPDLLKYVGKDLIVTDGTTLLGADDKAGIAEIMTLAQYLLSNPQIPHGEIKIGFTPDEEVGRGVDFFDVKRFGADFAYTVDGGELGELEYENFNAASAKLIVHGTSIHPGSAKGKMKNAVLLAMEFQGMLPVFDNPAYTEGYEGFFHLDSIHGSVDLVTANYIIRDHDRTKFEEKKELFQKTADFLNERYGAGTFEVQIKDSYYNMKEQVAPHMHLIDNAMKAMKSLEIEPIVVPIRGGTDGARLSYMGLPCPNICTGGHNFHGRYEYICVQSMEMVVETLKKIVEIYSTKDYK